MLTIQKGYEFLNKEKYEKEYSGGWGGILGEKSGPGLQSAWRPALGLRFKPGVAEGFCRRISVVLYFW